MSITRTLLLGKGPVLDGILVEGYLMMNAPSKNLVTLLLWVRSMAMSRFPIRHILFGNKYLTTKMVDRES